MKTNNPDLTHEQVENARYVLEMLGMDQERCNERSALVLLALLNLSPGLHGISHRTGCLEPAQLWISSVMNTEETINLIREK